MSRTITATALAVALLGNVPARARPGEMPRVAVAKDKKGFVLDPSGRPFVPWGLNYDHDDKGRLIEDYWEDEWPTVEAHFGQMKKLGANVVRVHLQLGKFMDGPGKPNAKALGRLGKLLALAVRLRLYLDLTGLGCYHKKDVPAWYVLAQNDRMVAPDNQRFMAERMAARIRPIEADHTPIVTAPDPVVSTILEAIQTSSH